MAAQEWNGNGAGMGWEWHRNGMALECFLFLILTSKGFIDCGPGIAQEWYRNDTKWYKMVQEWSRNGTKWYRNGAKWYRNGTGMVQKWYRNGTKNGTAINSTGMVQNGPGMVQKMVQEWHIYASQCQVNICNRTLHREYLNSGVHQQTIHTGAACTRTPVFFNRQFIKVCVNKSEKHRLNLSGS